MLALHLFLLCFFLKNWSTFSIYRMFYKEVQIKSVCLGYMSLIYLSLVWSKIEVNTPFSKRLVLAVSSFAKKTLYSSLKAAIVRRQDMLHTNTWCPSIHQLLPIKISIENKLLCKGWVDSAWYRDSSESSRTYINITNTEIMLCQNQQNIVIFFLIELHFE